MTRWCHTAGSRRNTAPFQLVLGSLAPGQHSLTVVVTFRGAGSAFKPFIETRWESLQQCWKFLHPHGHGSRHFPPGLGAH